MYVYVCRTTTGDYKNPVACVVFTQLVHRCVYCIKIESLIPVGPMTLDLLAATGRSASVII